MSSAEKNNQKASLKAVPVEGRVLLLPHCLRRSDHCRARYQRESGLQCEGCDLDCPVNLILEAARQRNWGGICVAAGGSMSVAYLKQHQPQGILAVACPKELTLGIEAIMSLSSNGWNPVVVTIDLTRDGCLDTEVDVEEVLEFINL
jgi:hypothetical protein